MSNTINYIIIQAGGRGSRLGKLTDNKPKALVSVHGEPLIIRQMRLNPKAHYYIIADYKRDILEKYLKLYAPASYEIIYTTGKQTCSGINTCVKKIPDNTPFLITWCDLYFDKVMYPNKLAVDKNNYIGLSKTFPCRWKFEKGLFAEEKTNSYGVAGFFIFKNTNEIGEVDENGELCRYLADKHIKFLPFFLEGVHEVGTIEAYESFEKEYSQTRPFNRLLIKGNKVTKEPIDSQGKKLASLEANWYKHLQGYNYGFISKIYEFNPITMAKVKGLPLYQTHLSVTEKKKVLKQIIESLNTIHSIAKPKKSSYENDYEAILGKTKQRLDSIISLIPDGNKNTISINGRECINFYKKWHLVEKLLKRFFPKEYVYIHGDLTFSNTLYDKESQKLTLIDPRGYYGKYKMYGDEDYDWAKVYYSIVGNYDQFNTKNFRLTVNLDNNILDITSNGWEKLEDYFFELTKRSPNKIRAYHAIIWLSLTSYAWDNYDAICGAFYNGIYLMQDLYEKSL